MEVEFLTKIREGIQDGAISNGFLFSFNRRGGCTVYEIDELEKQKGEEAEVYSQFTLDKSDVIVPHSNSVVFGSEYYDEKDEFPLVYANVYNNYAKEENKLKGVCLVYRIQRKQRQFTTTLVQIIEIGFVEDERLWKSSGENEDTRPYGNFVIDTENGIYYAFTMRDNTNTTRYFSFDLPKAEQGEICEKYNVKKVVLNASDIRDFFDCDYHRLIQGACCHKGKIYSLEGYTESETYPAAIRIIDPKLKKEIAYKKFEEFGIDVEPEMIDFYEDVCYYAINNGSVYKISF